MSGHFCKLNKFAAPAAADIKSNLFNGPSSAGSTQSFSMISSQTLGATAASADAHTSGGAHENRFLAGLASMAAASSSGFGVTASCLTGSTAAQARSRSNSITNNAAAMPFFSKQPSEELHASSGSSSFMNMFSFKTSPSAMASGERFNGILRNQNLNLPAEPKVNASLMPPKSLSLTPATSTPTCPASAMASALTNALAPLFIEPAEVISKLKNNVIILLDCRTWTEFNTTHIKDSVHLNCRDKITRKRLQTRKVTVKDLISCEEVKSKLELNETKPTSSTSTASEASSSSIADESSAAAPAPLQRSSSHCSQLLAAAAAAAASTGENGQPSNNMIVLYDDTTSELEDLQSDANPLKIVQENIKQCGYKKECKILKGGFKEFSKHWPSLCVLKEKSEKFLNSVFCDAQQDQAQSAIENAVMNEIMPHLYLGNEMDAKNEQKLVENGIYYILNVTKNIPFYTNPSNAKFVHKRIAVNDCASQNLKQHFDEAIEFIDEAKKNNSKVLVHCQAGVSRSPTIVIAYLMQTMRLSMNDALNRVRQARPIVAPNLIFMSQLSDFETRIFASADSKKVEENGAASEGGRAAEPESDDSSSNQNVNTKHNTLLLTETNDQKRVEKIDRPAVAATTAMQDDISFAEVVGFHHFRSAFSSDSNSSSGSSDVDEQSCLNAGGLGAGHHNANEVVVCN